MEWPDFIATRARALAAWGRGERGDRLRAEIGRLHDLSREAGLTYMESTLAPLVRAD